MGSCMSTKAGREALKFKGGPAPLPLPPLRRKIIRTMDDEYSDQKEVTNCTKRNVPSPGIASSFGFRRPQSATNGTLNNIPANVNATSKTAPKKIICEDTSHKTPTDGVSKKTTPQLPRPTKDVVSGGAAVAAGRTNRFGFRKPANAVARAGLSNRVGEASAPVLLNQPPGATLARRPAHSASNGRVDSTASHDGRSRKPATALMGRPPTTGSVPCLGATAAISDGNRKVSPRNIISQPVQASRYTLQSSQLPRPQFAVRTNPGRPLSSTSKPVKSLSSYNCHSGSSVDEGSSSKESSMNEDSGLGSQPGIGCGDTDTLHGIEILDNSPRAARPRHLRMVLSGGGKSFSLRDEEDDPNVITEIVPISAPLSQNKKSPRSRLIQERVEQFQPREAPQRTPLDKRTVIGALMDGHIDEGLGYDFFIEDADDGIEVKVSHDQICAEKGPRGRYMKEYGPGDDDWGQGEAMADGPEWQQAIADIEEDVSVKTPPLQPIMLNIETDSGEVGLLEDESAPEDSIFSSGPPSSDDNTHVEKVQVPKRKVRSKTRGSLKDSIGADAERIQESKLQDGEQGHLLSPDSSETPSNSVSLSDNRDFLIDDEIADQPGLVFGDVTKDELDIASEVTSLMDSTASLTLRECVSKQAPSVAEHESPLARRRLNRRRDQSGRDPLEASRAGSLDTLSPCASIASDDLMMDFERSECSTVDDGERTLRSLDETLMVTTTIKGSDEHGNPPLRDWVSLLNSHHSGATGRNRLLRSRASSGNNSTPESPRSVGVASPLRPARQVTSSDSEDSNTMRLDRATYQYMFQDIVGMKTMLLKLKRVLQDSESISPYDGSLKNGILHPHACNDVSGEDDDLLKPPSEDIADLKRQMILMKQQMEEKDRIIQLLQAQIIKLEHSDDESSDRSQEKEMCNAATQTERIRPVSAGPSILQSLPSDANGAPLVSWTDSWGRRGKTVSSNNRSGVTMRQARSLVPASHRLSLGSSATSNSEPTSNIPLARPSPRRATANSTDSVPNSRKSASSVPRKLPLKP